MKAVKTFLGLCVLTILATCLNPLHELNNPVDEESDSYVGEPSEDLDGDGIGQYEDVDDVVLLEPKDGATVPTATPLLSIYPFNSEKIKQYWIQIAAAESDFDAFDQGTMSFSSTAIPFSKDTYYSNKCAVPPGVLQNNTRYFWRAKAHDGAKWSDYWSSHWNGLRSFIVSAIAVNPTSGLITTEAGGIASFTVRLNSQPAADVVIGLSSSDTSEGTVSPYNLIFSESNWSVSQTVTVVGVDDPIIDGNKVYSVVTSATVSSDPNWNGLKPADVSAVNIDDDPAGFIVNPSSGLVSTEPGGTASFTVRLSSQPAADVTIGLSSSDISEGTVSPASLVFTSSNWDTAQPVTVTGANDDVRDGDQNYSIILAVSSSIDPNYDGIDPPDVTVINIDDDIPSFIINPLSGLMTTEAGGTASFTVKLRSQPAADVTIALSCSDVTEGEAIPSSLTFTTVNWSNTQTVTVTGVNDFVHDGDQLYTIVTAPASSGDPDYNGLNPSDVSLTNTDDDPVGITVSPTSGLVTTEGGGTANFTVRLTSQPTSSVTIGLSSSDTTEGTVSPSSLTFTVGNWNSPQTVTVTGANDSVYDGDQLYTIVTASASSGDLDYNGRDPPNVSVTNNDDEPPPPIAPSGLTATEVVGLDVYLTWTDNSNNETGFKIERKTGSGGSYAQIGGSPVGANITSKTDTGLNVYTTYYYRVCAYNGSGNSSYVETNVYMPPMYGMTITSCTISDTTPEVSQAVTLSGTGGQVHGGDYSDVIKVVIGYRDASGNWSGGTPQVIWSGTPGPDWQSWSGSNATINAPSTSGTYYAWVRNVAALDDATAIQNFKNAVPTSADEQRDDRWGTAVTVQQSTAVIWDAWWTNKVDLDGDGYVRSAILHWDPDVSGAGTLTVYEKIYYRLMGGTFWTLLAQTSPHAITGSAVDDLTLSISGNSHDEYYWLIEIYRSGQSSPDYTRNISNDSDLWDFWWETSAED
jgi:hypothetical protein